jgi:GAF domain-containing protein
MLLEPMLARLAGASDLTELLDVAVRDLVALHGAEMGDLQLVAGNGDLLIVAARGVNRAFLQLFERVSADSGSACGRAARDRRPTFIPDVRTDPEYAVYRNFAGAVPFRSVLSYPLTGATGGLLGMLSALSSHLFQPTALELLTAQSYCERLAALVEKSMPGEALARWAEARSASLIDATPERLRTREGVH